MTTESLKRLQYLIDTIPGLLAKIPEGDFSKKTSPDKWSKKETLGHLIDSATNNHQRFVRTQFENAPVIFYDQNNWNSFNHYMHLDTAHLISFWTVYNKHLAEVVKSIPKENMKRECNTGGEKNYSIEWIFNDYVQHLEHHLKQIVDYK